MEIIRIVEDSELSTCQTLKELGIHRSTFYNWYRRYLKDGVEGLGATKPKARSFLGNWSRNSQGSWVITTTIDTTNP
mgnify:CR=1 FL=1